MHCVTSGWHNQAFGGIKVMRHYNCECLIYTNNVMSHERHGVSHHRQRHKGSFMRKALPCSDVIMRWELYATVPILYYVVKWIIQSCILIGLPRIRVDWLAFYKGCHSNGVISITPLGQVMHEYLCEERHVYAWWHHQMETFSALLALCAGNSLVTGEFPSQRPVTWSFDVFFDLRLNKRWNKQPWRRLLEVPWRSLWHHCTSILIVSWCTKLVYHRLDHLWQSWWRHQLEIFSGLWAFLRGIHRSPVNCPHKYPQCGFFKFCDWTNDWANNRDAVDLRRHHAHYDVTVMFNGNSCMFIQKMVVNHYLQCFRHLVRRRDWSTAWARDKMAAILQMLFSNSFSRLKIMAF